MLPTISTRTCSHAGAVKPSLNGCIHSASLAGTSRLELPSLITPPNRRPGRLARSRPAANPALDHIGFNASQAENGQSPAEKLWCGAAPPASRRRAPTEPLSQQSRRELTPTDATPRAADATV